MNERIRECWLKAAKEDSGEKWDTQEEFIERFARLIVRECCEIAKWTPSMFPPDEIVKNIEEHFGIEK